MPDFKKWADLWASFPEDHKDHFYYGLKGYGLFCAVLAGWIYINAEDTVEIWNSRVPSARGVVKSIYITPQLTAASASATASEAVPARISFDKKDLAVTAERGATIALIMTNLGFSPSDTDRALHDLPPEVALAFTPYANDLKISLKNASQMKREALVLMPMESATFPHDDPGPRAISSRLSDKDNEDNLNWLLAQSKGSVGVMNFMGTRFLTDRRRLEPVFETLQRNGTMFIETSKAVRSVAGEIAGKTQLPYLSVDLQIDAVLTEKDIQGQLLILEKIAHERGYAIGVMEPYPLTFNMVKTWAKDLDLRGVSLEPLTTVWKNKPQETEPPAPTPAPVQPPPEKPAAEPAKG